jgi:hypothetical protein
MDTYTEILEKRVEELEDTVASYNPTIYNILNLLIEQKRKVWEQKISYMDYMGFLRYYCTIKFNMGRCVGHTTALKQIFEENLSTTMYIVPRKIMLGDIRQGISLDQLGDELMGRNFTKNLILADNFLGNESLIDKLYTDIGILAGVHAQLIFVIT